MVDLEHARGIVAKMEALAQAGELTWTRYLELYTRTAG